MSDVRIAKDIIERLAAYRLRQDLTYSQLAEEAQRAGFRIKQRSLHLVITSRRPVSVMERTAYKITQFVLTVIDPSMPPPPSLPPPKKRSRHAAAQPTA